MGDFRTADGSVSESPGTSQRLPADGGQSELVNIVCGFCDLAWVLLKNYLRPEGRRRHVLVGYGNSCSRHSVPPIWSVPLGILGRRYRTRALEGTFSG